MASEVEIANLALAHLGDTATVASLSPPEGSAQAEHCARFYPIARDELLQAHPWGFACKRITLAELGTPPAGWAYAYARPVDALDLLAVQPPETPDDFQRYPYACEADAAGVPLIYTDVPSATARYVARITDTTRFPPLFVSALSWQLASMLAGPILKGDAGRAEAKRCAQMAAAYLAQAKASDANQQRVTPAHVPDWIAASRGNLSWGR